ncbi:hypothetical protein Tco_1292380 [Tanacetum coccineum]
MIRSIISLYFGLSYESHDDKGVSQHEDISQNRDFGLSRVGLPLYAVTLCNARKLGQAVRGVPRSILQHHCVSNDARAPQHTLWWRLNTTRTLDASVVRMVSSVGRQPEEGDEAMMIIVVGVEVRWCSNGVVWGEGGAAVSEWW